MQKYVIALYIRLSLEDYKYDSMSIENQHLALNEFVSSMPESAHAEILEFIDNGYSGTNFERPKVQELIEMVRANIEACFDSFDHHVIIDLVVIQIRNAAGDRKFLGIGLSTSGREFRCPIRPGEEVFSGKDIRIGEDVADGRFSVISHQQKPIGISIKAGLQPGFKVHASQDIRPDLPALGLVGYEMITQIFTGLHGAVHRQILITDRFHMGASCFR